MVVFSLGESINEFKKFPAITSVFVRCKDPYGVRLGFLGMIPKVISISLCDTKSPWCEASGF